MANQAEIDETYTFIDVPLRVNFGEFFDFSCAYFESPDQSVWEAQRSKHRKTLEALQYEAGQRLLDIGCGWGPMVKAIREAGGQAVGITLSSSQVASCEKNGLEDVHLMDWRDLEPTTFGTFSGVVSHGAFEHFCSVEEFQAGRQDDIYEDFFARCKAVLAPGGRVHLQTMCWGPNGIPYEAVDLNADPDSTEYLSGLLEKFYPGSWLPLGHEQIVAAAERAGFRTIDVHSGREDWIRTIEGWQPNRRKKSWRKILNTLRYLPRYVRSKDFRYAVECGDRAAQLLLLQREALEHHRYLFERLD